MPFTQSSKIILFLRQVVLLSALVAAALARPDRPPPSYNAPAPSYHAPAPEVSSLPCLLKEDAHFYNTPSPPTLTVSVVSLPRSLQPSFPLRRRPSTTTTTPSRTSTLATTSVPRRPATATTPRDPTTCCCPTVACRRSPTPSTATQASWPMWSTRARPSTLRPLPHPTAPPQRPPTGQHPPQATSEDPTWHTRGEPWLFIKANWQMSIYLSIYLLIYLSIYVITFSCTLFRPGTSPKAEVPPSLPSYTLPPLLFKASPFIRSFLIHVLFFLLLSYVSFLSFRNLDFTHTLFHRLFTPHPFSMTKSSWCITLHPFHYTTLCSICNSFKAKPVTHVSTPLTLRSYPISDD